MRFGTTVKPALAGLGASIVIAVGAISATSALADPTTDPSSDPSSPPTTPTPTPPSTPTGKPPSHPPTHPPTKPPTKPPPGKTPSLSISLSLSGATAAPGGSVTANVHVSASRAAAHNAVIRVSASGVTVAPDARGLGTIGSGSLSSAVLIPAGHAAGRVTVTATVSADHAGSRSASRTITVSGSPGISPPGGTAPNLPSGMNAPGVSGVRLPAGSPVQLPLLAPNVAVPNVAPMTVAGRQTELRGFGSPLGPQNGFQRLIYTQVAWLTALLTAFGLFAMRLRLARAVARRRHRRTAA